jgi:hypothetical protein
VTTLSSFHIELLLLGKNSRQRGLFRVAQELSLLVYGVFSRASPTGMCLFVSMVVQVQFRGRGGSRTRYLSTVSFTPIRAVSPVTRSVAATYSTVWPSRRITALLDLSDRNEGAGTVEMLFLTASEAG